MTTRFRTFVGRPIPGGWHYPVPGGPTIKGENAQDLIDKVTEYRVCNGLPIGDPKSEITAWYTIHFPFTVENCEAEEPNHPDELRDGVYAWINDLWKNPPHEYAEPDEVVRRQDTCKKCPWRADIPKSDSRAALESERRLFLLSRGGLGPSELGVCRFAAWDNRLACMLTKEKIDCGECPKCCWVKSLDKLAK